MTIEQIDSSKVLIVLGSDDMRDFSLKYSTMSFSDPHSRKILSRLLHLACTKTGISPEGKKMIVEALPRPDGCLILLTLKPELKRRFYRIKRKSRSVCRLFENVEQLIQASIALCKEKYVPDNCVYYYNEKYYMTMENSDAVTPRVYAILCEYSQEAVYDKVAIARIEENGVLVSKDNAHSNIGKYF